ncbi:MAG: toll/interleukin-1 receptor domain-containing protein [Dechloromonas sp.]|nr:MAG: toll/interleukin-1 receptor domain-containing protein [Dechloromonas sp.]
MADIFLSYRRQDSQSATGRLGDRLTAHFGPMRVFRDRESIVAGDDFAEAIRRAIGTSVVVLVIVGPDWLTARTADGRRRLDDEADFVRLEIESALLGGVPVIPVLVEGAVMPAATALPPSLARFARCQATELSDTRWNYDVDRLIAMLQARFAIESEQAVPGSGSAADGHLNPFARLALDLLELASHPTRLIARQQTGHALDHVRAFMFLLAVLVLGNFAFLLSVGAQSLGEWIAVGVILGLLTVTFLATMLTLAWRIVGTRIEFRQVTLILAYIYAGVWIGFCAGALLAATGVQLVAPEVFTDYLAIVRTTAPLGQRMAEARALLEQTLHGPAAALFVIACLVWGVAAVWTVVAWGAFRNSFGCTRLKALAATSVWLAILLTLTQLAALAGRSL